jgi:hypothetical protein
MAQSLLSLLFYCIYRTLRVLILLVCLYTCVLAVITSSHLSVSTKYQNTVRWYFNLVRYSTNAIYNTYCHSCCLYNIYAFNCVLPLSVIFLIVTPFSFPFLWSALHVFLLVPIAVFSSSPFPAAGLRSIQHTLQSVHVLLYIRAVLPAATVCEGYSLGRSMWDLW